MTDEDIAAKFWKALKSDRTIMLGLDTGESKPMAALLDEAEHAESRLWIFTSKQTAFAQALAESNDAHATFASKGHDVFAALDGVLQQNNDRAVIDRLWSPFVAAWYPGGKEDPDLLLLQFDLTSGHVWLNETSIFSVMKLLLGVDPKKEYADKTADLPLN